MPSKVPPTGSQMPGSAPEEPTKAKSSSGTTKHAPYTGKGGQQTLNDLLSACTPEEKKKFWNIMNQNIARQIDKDNKKIVEELRKEREDIQKG